MLSKLTQMTRVELHREDCSVLIVEVESDSFHPCIVRVARVVHVALVNLGSTNGNVFTTSTKAHVRK